MAAAEYARRRQALLAAAAWNGWAHRRGYNPNAGRARRQNQRELATLRTNRRSVL